MHDSCLAPPAQPAYHAKYRTLAAAVTKLTDKIAAAGMTVIHAHNRVRGSTAFGVEDPSARVMSMLKKKGHGARLGWAPLQCLRELFLASPSLYPFNP